MDPYEIKAYLQEAYEVAGRSPDQSNQNGAILISDERIITGKNEPPHGIPMTQDRSEKKLVVEHAERAVIYSAARYGVQTEGGWLFCPWAACTDCARAIVLSGIHTLVVHEERMLQTPERWEREVQEGMKILELGGVVVRRYEGEVGARPIIVNGKPWNP